MKDKPSVTALAEIIAKNFRSERTLTEYNIQGCELITHNIKKEDPKERNGSVHTSEQ